MCEKATEIQAIWHSLELIGTLPSNKGFGLHYEKGYDGSFCWDGESVYCVDYEYCTSYKPTDIWIPRQDQLQEMIGEFPRNFERFADEAGQNAFDYSQEEMGDYQIYDTGCTSMEQRWLAFVMKEKYQKTWNGENWINAQIQESEE
jgi:hypothetical protein